MAGFSVFDINKPSSQALKYAYFKGAHDEGIKLSSGSFFTHAHNHTNYCTNNGTHHSG